MKYRPGYKYQTADVTVVPLTWYRGPDVVSDFVAIAAGRLVIRAGYAWDGPSGPTLDTASAMLPSLVHDALYQLIREGVLDVRHRKDADEMLARMFLWRMLGRRWVANCAPLRWLAQARAWLWYVAVRNAAGFAARGDGGHPLLEAP